MGRNSKRMAQSIGNLDCFVKFCTDFSWRSLNLLQHFGSNQLWQFAKKRNAHHQIKTLVRKWQGTIETVSRRDILTPNNIEVGVLDGHKTHLVLALGFYR